MEEDPPTFDDDARYRANMDQVTQDLLAREAEKRRAVAILESALGGGDGVLGDSDEEEAEDFLSEWDVLMAAQDLPMEGQVCVEKKGDGSAEDDHWYIRLSQEWREAMPAFVRAVETIYEGDRQLSADVYAIQRSGQFARTTGSYGSVIGEAMGLKKLGSRRLRRASFYEPLNPVGPHITIQPGCLPEGTFVSFTVTHMRSFRSYDFGVSSQWDPLLYIIRYFVLNVQFVGDVIPSTLYPPHVSIACAAIRAKKRHDSNPDGSSSPSLSRMGDASSTGASGSTSSRQLRRSRSSFPSDLDIILADVLERMGAEIDEEGDGGRCDASPGNGKEDAHPQPEAPTGDGGSAAGEADGGVAANGSASNAAAVAATTTAPTSATHGGNGKGEAHCSEDEED